MHQVVQLFFMYPFINLFHLHIPLYGLSIATGILLVGLIIYFLCKKKQKSFYDFLIIFAVSVFFGFIGAKLLFLILYYPFKEIPEIIVSMLFNPKNNMIGQGFVFYGGIITGVPSYFLGCKIAKCKYDNFLPEAAISVPFIHGFGRIGCFFAGCCYGIPYEGPLALHYSTPLTDVSTTCGIFPVQLFEAFLTISFSVIMIFFYLKNRKISFIYYLIFYSITRFCLEYLRGDVIRKHFGPFSTSQWISLFIFNISLIFFLAKLIITKSKKTV